jgi:thioredoxin reductase
MPVQATSEIRLSSGRLDFYEGKQVVVAAGLESDREGKEVYNDQEGGKHACYTSHPPAVGQDPPVVVVADSRSRKKWFFMIVAGILIIVVAISIAVALVVSRNKK